MEEIRLSTREAYMYGVLITACVGFVVGLVPLIFGIVKKQLKLGILGLIASTVGGALLGLLLAVPFAAIFMWLIVRKPSTAAASGGGGAA